MIQSILKNSVIAAAALALPLVVNISAASRLKGLVEPEPIIPLLLGADLTAIKKTEIYEKVWEYTHNDITIEVGPGREYSIPSGVPARDHQARWRLIHTAPNQ